ncbi:MAG: Gfo/Idh/MocA family oxidoreductase [Eubacteriales bacterium]|nr:Gfo/Idh/MocA family oxidoreductase [Eubacteriales bacterium]
MISVGLIGMGFMGKAHIDIYNRLNSEGFPVKLVALCDIDPEKLKGNFKRGNIDIGGEKPDMSRYRLYDDPDKMLDTESRAGEITVIDITLPTYLHSQFTIKALLKGFNVLCEKPMALNTKECLSMSETAAKTGKKLMIAQCLRFQPAYEYLKACVTEGRYGKVNGAYFYRGGSTPVWSHLNWLLKSELSGGALLDQHIHDVDTINWLFGLPEKVSSVAKNVIPGSGYDIVSTNYIYADGRVINAQDDWTLNGGYGFRPLFRVGFEKGNIVWENNVLTDNPNEGKSFIPELPKESGYIREIRYFLNAVSNNSPVTEAPPENTALAIRIAEAEKLSADKKGEPVSV